VNGSEAMGTSSVKKASLGELTVGAKDLRISKNRCKLNSVSYPLQRHVGNAPLRPQTPPLSSLFSQSPPYQAVIHGENSSSC